ncbi:MAG TPA: Mur ligase family protein, partial [Thermohalobaculum sp.]|nr:Mur ligase family protein [Thermohalobaculum sp.]
YLVQEVSAEGPGTLDEMIELLRPNFAIVTAVGLDHYKAFRTHEAVAAEKGKLVERLPADGVAILNADDPNVIGMASRTSARVVSYGLSENADIRALDVSCIWPERLTLTVAALGQTRRIETGLFGTQFTSSVLAAIATALQLGLSLDECAERLGSALPLYQRMSIHPHPSGAWFIADTYKAPAWSINASLAALEGASAPRRTVVIGTISDVRGDESRLYERAGRSALEVADRVIFAGEKSSRARKLKNGDDADRVMLFPVFLDLVKWLDENLVEDEVVLLKSGTNHLERLFLFPKYGVYCALDNCTYKGSCIKCEVTNDVAGLRNATKEKILLHGPDVGRP